MNNIINIQMNLIKKIITLARKLIFILLAIVDWIYSKYQDRRKESSIKSFDFINKKLDEINKKIDKQDDTFKASVRDLVTKENFDNKIEALNNKMQNKILPKVKNR